jgi:hypothetical protein
MRPWWLLAGVWMNLRLAGVWSQAVGFVLVHFTRIWLESPWRCFKLLLCLLYKDTNGYTRSPHKSSSWLQAYLWTMFISYTSAPVYWKILHIPSPISYPRDKIFRVSYFSLWLVWSLFKSPKLQLYTSSRLKANIQTLTYIGCTIFCHFGFIIMFSAIENFPIMIFISIW